MYLYSTESCDQRVSSLGLVSPIRPNLPNRMLWMGTLIWAPQNNSYLVVVNVVNEFSQLAKILQRRNAPMPALTGYQSLSDTPNLYRISFSCCFCLGVKLVGNLTLYLTIKLPRSPGFLEMGMPSPG